MANETIYSGLVQLTAQIAGYVVENLRPAVVMRQLVAMEDITNQAGTMSKKFRKRGSLTASVVAEASASTAQVYSETSVSLTLQKATVYTIPTDEVIRFSDENEVEKLKVEATKAIAQKEDDDLVALFTGFSQTSGSTGTALTVAKINQGSYLLDLNNEDPNRGIVLHPRQVRDIKDEIVASSASVYVGGGVQSVTSFRSGTGFIGSLYGVAVFQTTLIDKVNTNADYCGAIMTQDAIAFLTNDIISMKQVSDPETMAEKIGIAKYYTCAELKDTAGIRLISIVA